MATWQEAAETKHTKQSVDYSKGMSGNHCGVCKNFMMPNSCKLVKGVIEESYWCKLFARKK